MAAKNPNTITNTKTPAFLFMRTFPCQTALALDWNILKNFSGHEKVAFVAKHIPFFKRYQDVFSASVAS
jgi:hypothetical protein